MLLLIGSLGTPEIILILGLALLLFGPKKLPELGRSLGKGIREFKKGTSGLMESLNEEVHQPVQQEKRLAPATPVKQPTPQPAAAGPAPTPPDDSTEVVIDLEKEGKKG